MPAPSEVISAATVEGGLVKATLLAALVERSAYVLGATETLADLSQDAGLIYQAIVAAATGYLYFYDATDTTTADDGLTCLVDGSGHRYHLASSATISLSSVLDVLNTPPGSPVIGDAYVVDTAPTGTWAAHATDIAIFTRRGWVFATPQVGHTLYDQSSGANIQFDENGDWVPFSAGASNISPADLQFPAGLVVENTLNTPPGGPSAGQFWIVGGSPTGAWVGHSTDLTYWTGTAWAFLDAAAGWTVFHKTFGFQVSFIGGAWLGGSGSDLQTFSTPGAFSWTKPAKGSMALIEIWGAGASGARGTGSPGTGGGAGGGGAYLRLLVPLATLGSSVSGAVGAGGASRTTNNTNGQNGGNSTFGSFTGYGGQAGAFGTNAGAGGGGGGATSAGTAPTTNAPGGTGGAPLGGSGGGATSPGLDSTFGGGGGGGGSASGSGAGGAGGSSVDGGGGGGAGAPVSSNGGVGGNSVNGGAGGGGGGNGPAAGGTSILGGNGGAGADASAAASPGQQPGGGGGGSEGGNSGKGGDGRVRVTVW